MSVNQKIIQALSGLAPVYPDIYDGKANTYLTFNYTTRGAAYADDTPSFDVNLVQVHLFCPLKLDSVKLRRQVRAALFASGFTWPEVVNAEDGSMQKNDAGKQHYVFECEIEEGVALDGEV